MASSEYALPYASLIIRDYEKAAITASVDNQNRDLCAIPWLKSMSAFKMVIDSAEKVLLEETPGAEKGMQRGGARYAAQRDSPETEKQPDPADASEEKSACDKVKDVFNPDEDFEGFGPFFGEEGPGITKDHMEDQQILGIEDSDNIPRKLKNLLGEGLEALGMPKTEGSPWDSREYFEDCWSCMLNLDFSWQVAPINWASEINKLLKQIESMVNFMVDRFDSSLDLLKSFCWDGWAFLWKVTCPIDLIAIMAMLRGLLGKYKSGMLSLTLDWTAIVGPLMKGIVDATVSFIEQIAALMIQPTECLINMVQTFNQLIKSTVQTADSFGKFSDHIEIGAWSGEESLTRGGGWATDDLFADNEDEPHDTESIDIFGNRDYPIVDGKKIVPAHLRYHHKRPADGWAKFQIDMPVQDGEDIPEQDLPTASELPKNKKPVSPLSAQATGLRSDFGEKFKMNTGLQLDLLMDIEEEIAKDKPFEDWTGLDFITTALAKYKEWVRDLSQKVTFGYKSLGALFNGQLNLSVRNSGLMMLIIDMIAFIKFLSTIDKWADLECGDEATDSRVRIGGNVGQSLIASYPEYDVSVLGQGEGGDEEDMINPNKATLQLRRKADGAVENIVISNCTLEVDRASKGMENTFKALQKSTKYRKAAWGV